MNDFRVSRIRRLFGLTQAQARVVVALHYAELGIIQ